jgi:hypothetical protein
VRPCLCYWTFFLYWGRLTTTEHPRRPTQSLFGGGGAQDTTCTGEWIYMPLPSTIRRGGCACELQ